MILGAAVSHKLCTKNVWQYGCAANYILHIKIICGFDLGLHTHYGYSINPLRLTGDL